MITVSKRIEFDAGHRIPDHASKCRHLHGHRYTVEAEVGGLLHQDPGDPENGMVTDFGILKDLLTELVHEPWDHAFLVHEGDKDLVDYLWTNDFKHAVLSRVPTAENLALQVATELLNRLRLYAGLELTRVTVWETPTCSATWEAP